MTTFPRSTKETSGPKAARTPLCRNDGVKLVSRVVTQLSRNTSSKLLCGCVR